MQYCGRMTRKETVHVEWRWKKEVEIKTIGEKNVNLTGIWTFIDWYSDFSIGYLRQWKILHGKTTAVIYCYLEMFLIHLQNSPSCIEIAKRQRIPLAIRWRVKVSHCMSKMLRFSQILCVAFFCWKWTRQSMNIGH